MQLMPMSKLGPRQTSPSEVQFGVFFPWVSATNGDQVFVKIIHERDQFIQSIPPRSFPLTHALDPTWGDYWSATVSLQNSPPVPGSAWGQPGRYVYRFEVRSPAVAQPVDWIPDPFAREFSVGKLSAFTLGFEAHPWSANESSWRTPALRDLMVYEVMLSEFAKDLPDAISRLSYLADLGINCIEVMPVSNVTLEVDWGFLPVGYFGVDERFGNQRDFQEFVDGAHQRGIAVVLDSVYGHTSSDFPYQYLYDALHYHENPVMGPFAKDLFGASTDFARPFTQDYFFTINNYWLEKYHIDGFRYDCVPNYWDGGTGVGYANLVFNTYQLAKQQLAQGQWQRFQGSDGGLTIVQCAEQLEAPVEVVQQTYSNCTWQNGTLDAASGVAQGDFGRIAELGQRLGLSGYPDLVTVNGEALPKSAFQYISNHDHSRFICQFGTVRPGDGALLDEGNRNHWYKLQPYLIGLLMAKGIPLLWQGDELLENYVVPEGGLGRVRYLRPIHWDYFYDDDGRSVLTLVRKLVRIRGAGAQFRRGDHFFYDDWDRYQSKGLLLFSRFDQQKFSLVALNFSDSEQWAPFWFSRSGNYRDEIDGEDPLMGVVADTEHFLRVPSNYGRIWTL